VHHLFEKHLKAEYVLGFERFWKCEPTKPCLPALQPHPANAPPCISNPQEGVISG
jgi:hypothetical protein